MEVNVEDAETLLIRWIRENPSSAYSNYGYDIYLPNVIRWALSQQAQPASKDVERLMRPASPVFYSAAWELCRRGIIRPGVREMGLQDTADGSAGNGYSITPFGRQWASESEHDDFVPTEPQRFAQMLAPYVEQFGPGFHERAQEAVRCYGAHAYLSCCVMCGAASESILLAAATEKSGEEKTLQAYASARGRSRVQTALLANVNEAIRQEFSFLSVLLKYWRDEASHGKASKIRDNEAYTSLALLLRLAQFVQMHWTSLTSDSGRLEKSGRDR